MFFFVGIASHWRRIILRWCSLLTIWKEPSLSQAIAIKEQIEQILYIWSNYACFFYHCWRLLSNAHWTFGSNLTISRRNLISENMTQLVCNSVIRKFSTIICFLRLLTFSRLSTNNLYYFLAHSRLAKCHTKHFKCFLLALTFIFYTTFNRFFDNFFSNYKFKMADNINICWRSI